MLAGRPAFPSDTVAAAIYAVVHEPHEPLETRVPGTPAAVTRALDRALAKRPEQRFATIAELVEALTGRALETLDGVEARARATGGAAGGKGQGAGAANAGGGPQRTEMIAGGSSGAGAGAASDPWAATVASEPGIPVAGAAAPREPRRRARGLTSRAAGRLRRWGARVRAKPPCQSSRRPS